MCWNFLITFRLENGRVTRYYYIFIFFPRHDFFRINFFFFIQVTAQKCSTIFRIDANFWRHDICALKLSRHRSELSNTTWIHIALRLYTHSFYHKVSDAIIHEEIAPARAWSLYINRRVFRIFFLLFSFKKIIHIKLHDWNIIKRIFNQHNAHDNIIFRLFRGLTTTTIHITKYRCI